MTAALGYVIWDKAKKEAVPRSRYRAHLDWRYNPKAAVVPDHNITIVPRTIPIWLIANGIAKVPAPTMVLTRFMLLLIHEACPEKFWSLREDFARRLTLFVSLNVEAWCDRPFSPRITWYVSRGATTCSSRVRSHAEAYLSWFCSLVSCRALRVVGWRGARRLWCCKMGRWKQAQTLFKASTAITLCIHQLIVRMWGVGCSDGEECVRRTPKSLKSS